jgi:hypothetical protein
MSDPRSHARAAVLAGAMTFEPAPLDLTELRVPPIRRIVRNIDPPLDLSVIPFRYRVSERGIEVVKPKKCRHAHARSSART